MVPVSATNLTAELVLVPTGVVRDRRCDLYATQVLYELLNFLRRW